MVISMNTQPEKTGRNRRQKRVVRTRRRLKEAALDVFSEKSVDAATVEEITEKADVGKGTLYQHFEDKEEIVITLVEEAIEHLIERIRTCDRPPDTLELMLEHLTHPQFWRSSSFRKAGIMVGNRSCILSNMIRPMVKKLH